jgi:hypothetical protein
MNRSLLAEHKTGYIASQLKAYRSLDIAFILMYIGEVIYMQTGMIAYIIVNV